MQNSTITFRKVNGDNNLAAFAEVNLLDTYTVSGIKIWDNGDKGYNVQLPGSPKTVKGNYYENPFFRINKKGQNSALKDYIVDAYKQTLVSEESVPVLS